MSTDEVTAVAAKVLHVHPLVHVATTQPEVGVIVHAPAGDIARWRPRSPPSGIHVSFADDSGVPTRLQIGAAARARRRAAAGSAGLERCSAGCARAACCARRRARSACTTSFYYLRPGGGLSVGQLVLARTDGATPVKGALRLTATAPLPQRGCAPATCSWSSSTARPRRCRGLERIVAWLGAIGTRRRAARAG